MAFMEWTADLSVNDEIDAQHKRLFEIVVELHASVTEGAERSVLARVFVELIDYTIEHFRTEEGYFTELSYPDAERHTKEHDDLTAQVLELQKRFIEGDLIISFELLDFLYDWLMTHTGDSDIRFAKFLNEGIGQDPASASQSLAFD
jgi:hemerythrin-like metal-binding protein